MQIHVHRLYTNSRREYSRSDEAPVIHTYACTCTCMYCNSFSVKTLHHYEMYNVHVHVPVYRYLYKINISSLFNS